MPAAPTTKFGDYLRDRARALANAHLIEPARTDFASFCQFVLRDRRGNPLVWSDVDQLYADTLVWCWQTGTHLGNMAAFNLGKTTLIDAFLCWLIGNDPYLATTIISAEATSAGRQVGACRNLILKPEYRMVFPDITPDVHRGEFKRAGGGLDGQGFSMKEWFLRLPGRQTAHPTMSADGAVIKGAFRRVDVLFADDIISESVARSQTEIKTMKGAFWDTWFEGRFAGGRFCAVTHNCWQRTPKDLLHEIREDARFLSLWVGVHGEHCDRLFVRLWNASPNCPLLKNPDKYNATPIAPRDNAQAEFVLPLPGGRDNFAQTALLEKKAANGPRYRRAYQLIPISPDDLMFPAWPKRELFPGAVAEMLRLERRSDRVVANEMDNRRLVFAPGIDLGGGGTTASGHGKDVIALWAKDNSGVRYPVEFHRGSFTISQIFGILKDIYDRGFHFRLCEVENVAIQEKIEEVLRYWAERESLAWSFAIEGFKTGSNKFDPFDGLPSLDIELDKHSIIWPAEEKTLHPVWQSVEEEFEACPRLIPTGQTPDSPMASWFAISALDRLRPSGHGNGISVDTVHLQPTRRF